METHSLDYVIIQILKKGCPAGLKPLLAWNYFLKSIEWEAWCWKILQKSCNNYPSGCWHCILRASWLVNLLKDHLYNQSIPCKACIAYQNNRLTVHAPHLIWLEKLKKNHDNARYYPSKILSKELLINNITRILPSRMKFPVNCNSFSWQ